MQPYDFLMIAILVGLTLYGYTKGMAWQLAYLASLVVSYFVALEFADQFAPMFGTSAPLNKFVAMLVIYIVTSLGIWMIFRVVRGTIDRVRLEGFDHQMGALIGFARGILWCVGITFFAVTLLPQNMKEGIVSTKSGRYIALLLDKTQSVVPPEVHDVIGPVIERIERGLQQGGQPGPPGNNIPQGGPQQDWPGQGGQPQQPQQGGWPPIGQSGGWPSANPASNANAGNTGWPQNNPNQGNPNQGSGTPAQQVGWPRSQQ